MSDLQIKVLDVKPIPIDQISHGKHQVRTHNVEKDLDVLMNSLNKFGLVHAITVYSVDENQYELLTGQRRLVAATKLGWKEIRATIIEKPQDDMVSKAISFVENEIREKMVNRDVIDACNEFYHKYGTIKDVAETLALPEKLVSNAVKLPRCPKEVQDAVKKGDVDLKIAIKATDALRWDSGTIEEGSKVLELAERMENDKMQRDMQRAVVEVGRADPSQDLDTIIDKASQRKLVKVSITLASTEVDRLDKFAKDEQAERDEVITNLILDGLRERGY